MAAAELQVLEEDGDKQALIVATKKPSRQQEEEEEEIIGSNNYGLYDRLNEWAIWALDMGTCLPYRIGGIQTKCKADWSKLQLQQQRRLVDINNKFGILESDLFELYVTKQMPNAMMVFKNMMTLNREMETLERNIGFYQQAIDALTLQEAGQDLRKHAKQLNRILNVHARYSKNSETARALVQNERLEDQQYTEQNQNSIVLDRMSSKTRAMMTMSRGDNQSMEAQMFTYLNSIRSDELKCYGYNDTDDESVPEKTSVAPATRPGYPPVRSVKSQASKETA